VSPASRGRLLAAAAVCLVVVAVLAVMVRSRWDPLQDVDTDVGTPAESWSFHHSAAVKVLLGIELAFGTIGTVVYVVGLVGFLWLRGHRRAVAWTLLVMVGASATTTALKLLFRRHRPQWDDPVHALTSFSFPSGHASGIASGMGVGMVLALLYLAGRARRAALLAAPVLVLVVGADRILLGVHNLSDVVAGYAVGAFWVFAMLAQYPPEVGDRRVTGAGQSSGAADADTVSR
jgi:membrane-associated phospholipid phosphatase